MPKEMNGIWRNKISAGSAAILCVHFAQADYYWKGNYRVTLFTHSDSSLVDRAEPSRALSKAARKCQYSALLRRMMVLSKF